MIRFSNLKIPTKILMLLALLALVSLGSVVFATRKMRYIDDTYGDLIDGPGRANLAIARANKDLVEVDRDIYRLIAEETDEGDKAAMKELTSMQNYFDTQVKIAIKRMPSQADAIQKIADMFRAAMTGACASTLKFGTSADPAEKQKAVTSMRAQCDPALRTVMDNASGLTNDILKINDKDSDDAQAVTDATIRNTYTLVLGGLFIVLAAAAILTRSTISSPIRKMAMLLEELAKGNLETEIQGADRQDEVGEIARAALIFRDQGRETQRLRTEQERSKAQAENDRKIMMQGLADDFESSIQKIISSTADAATRLYHTAGSMQNTVARVNEQSKLAANSSQQTSGNVQNVYSSMEEMSNSVREIANQVTKSSALVNETVTRTGQADKTTLILSEAVAQISGILQLIQNIAGQINLLALNATIEAARAGEAGKGFAVVASEVKNLAGQTTKATTEIAKQIEDVQKASSEVVDVLKAIQEAIGNVNHYSSGIASAVEQQSAVSSAISTNMQQASEGVKTIAGNISQITQNASEADRSAVEVLSAAQELTNHSDVLNTQVAAFLNNIRTG